MGITTTISIERGVLTAYPNSVVDSEKRKGTWRTRKWAGILKTGEPSSDFLETFLTETGDSLVKVDKLKLRSAVVFACDQCEYGRVAVYNRWYGVVVGITESYVILEQYASQEEAYEWSKFHLIELPDWAK
ncbi:hypothetical protein KP001_09230 [Geomonas subterranea]|uniref:Uncharacterized protein n=1 Tax=Geomonas subterranea TaxID=2847989 RepID=A0ABX8LPQ4_9BACT|nr:hypothetical protein [Geomonas subterranea]QXE92680.1 hypothetical protein KP001_09230 [Geomonas subterranea]QXM09221.1 hypothetical protein KP002_20045 [Geomonas subterranea]